MAEEFIKTCFVDKNHRLNGILMLKEGVRVDFACRKVFLQDQPKKMSGTDYSVLEYLIYQAPKVASYEGLFDAYYGVEDASGRSNLKSIRNVISRLRRFAEIDNLQNVGYRIELSGRIARRHDVAGEDVENIAALFEDAVDPHAAETAQSFSCKYFHAGANALKDVNLQTVLEQLDRLSGVFDPIASIRRLDEEPTRKKDEHILRKAYALILNNCAERTPQHVLKIKGPLGSYKNRIMQYLFLAIAKCGKALLPIYMDLAFYDRIAEQSGSFESAMMELENDYKVLRTLIESKPHLTPVILLDGVHNYQYNREVPYNTISEQLEAIPCKLVVCEDTDFTVNSENLFSVHPLAPRNFEYTIRIEPIKLIHKRESIAFIKQCIDVFSIPVSVPAERIYEVLRRLNFLYLDAYWLRFLLTTAGQALFDARQTIFSLYHSICIRYLDDQSLEDAAADLAFRYEIDPSSITDMSVYQTKIWQLITKHRSVKDYLIARHYVQKIAHVNYNNKDHDAVVRELSFFNMVLPKDITRFVVPMINGVDDYEHKIMIIAEKYYDDLSVLGKSELTFWMARLKNRKRQNKCSKLLHSFNEKEVRRYRQDAFENDADKKDSAFLIRGIQVSLIYENDANALNEYLNSLIFDKTANAVNRGFHLEYYGDKPYVPYHTLLDYEDDLTKGENTFSVLCLSLDKIKRTDRTVPMTAPLDLVTLCSLIQARIEEPVAEDTFDVSPYITKCISYLETMINSKLVRSLPLKNNTCGLPNVAKYFRWMHATLQKMQQPTSAQPGKKLRYAPASVFNKFSRAHMVRRTGWVNLGVNIPENIVEHMYNCWLIGMLHLPDKIDDPAYNKDLILRMLLIHDLGETETGDITRPQKMLNPSLYDQEENRVMQDFLFSGSYPHAVDLSGYFHGWSDWEKKQGINYNVAKDIDDLQTIYRFCEYYVQTPEKFTLEDVLYWLSGLERFRTDVVREIADALIVRNPLFSKIINQYFKDSER